MLRAYFDFENTEEARRLGKEHPLRFLWICLILTVIGFAPSMFIPTLQKFQPITRLGIVVIINTVSIILYALYITWLLKRQEKKSWGVPLPEETRILMIRTGVWWGLMISAIYQGLVYYPSAIAFLATQDHIFLIAAKISDIFGAGLSLRGLTNYYQIPKKKYLFNFVFGPIILLSIVGIIVAIALGVHTKYQKEEMEHEHPTVKQQLMQSPTTPQINMGAQIVPPMKNFFSTEPYSIEQPNMHCMGGQPMNAPRQVIWKRKAVVIQVVPKRNDEMILREAEHYVHGWIEPQYQEWQRIEVHPLGAKPSVHFTVVAPVGMTVHTGQVVEIESYRASHTKACEYIPNRIIGEE